MKKILKYLFFGTILMGLGILLNLYRKHQKPIFQKAKIKEIPHAHTFYKKHVHTKRKHRNILAHDFGLRNKKRIIVGLSVLLLSGVVGEIFLQEYSSFLRTSLLNVESGPFTGTIAPVEKVPNWVQLTDNERKLPFDKLPKSKLINLPPYNPAIAKKGYASKASGNELARNTYITYSVLNMGDYHLAANEGNGSHTGVDIKLPMNTPIRAIADGVVYKAENQPTGFGVYVSLAHMDVPELDNPKQKTNIVSTYAHLSKNTVQDGQKVKKGQVIGYSGNSGMATAPHLHFQIDRDSASFHPYWPFSWSDVKSSGLNSYFEAVNAGVGANNGYKHTVHPMNFVMAFENYQGIDQNLVVSTAPIIKKIEKKEEVSIQKKSEENIETKEQKEGIENKESEKNTSTKEEEKIIPEEKLKIIKKEQEEPEKEDIFYASAKTKAAGANQSFHRAMMEESLLFETDLSFIPGEEEIVELRIDDANLIASNGILIESTLKHLAQIQPSQLKKKDFHDGKAQIRVTTTSDSSFRLIAKGDFGQVKSKSLRASIFTDIPKTHQYSEAIKYLKDNNIIKGYDDGTFRAENQINRAEAVKILLIGNSIPAIEIHNDFPDVGEKEWFGPYVSTASKRGIVKGYPDGSFKPAQSISRAEFLKVALETARFTVPDSPTADAYGDVASDAWFARYMSVAKRYNFFETYAGSNVEPARPITRGEAAYIMYRIEELS